MTAVILGVVTVMAVCVAGHGINKLGRLERRARLLRRGSSPEQEWLSACVAYPSGVRRLVQDVLDLIAVHVDVPLEYLRPDDSFSGSLAIRKWFLPADEFDELESELGILCRQHGIPTQRRLCDDTVAGLIKHVVVSARGEWHGGLMAAPK